MYKLDRTAFSAGSHKELSDKNREHWKSQSMEERLRAAAYLNSVAWNYPLDTPPKMDRSVFSMRKHR
ncbi:hypothetical protein [uncultured Imperialibacter sp.]|jgi:hypothetical protein|uniref:hypothetical protein n=1 Tax=uncultured Imperialibacter sp. TaxID=1672639 RepID=UPI0030DA6469